MKYQLLQNLLPYLEEYERTNAKNADPQHFAVWLTRQTTDSVPTKQEGHAQESPEVNISRLVVYMTRYAKQYARKALEGSPLSSMDEYVYLIATQQLGPLSKTELIHISRHEKPTGMDIIRRLINLGLIQQTNDPEDRRSKRLAVTPAGEALIRQLDTRMTLVSHIVAGNLNKSERLQLLQLLEKLETFHQVLLAKTKGGAFETLAHTALKG